MTTSAELRAVSLRGRGAGRWLRRASDDRAVGVPGRAGEDDAVRITHHLIAEELLREGAQVPVLVPVDHRINRVRVM